MKKYFVVLLGLWFVSCGENKTKDKPENETLASDAGPIPEDTVTERPVSIDTSRTLGLYTGSFIATKLNESKDPSYSNAISLFIDKMEAEKVYGHTVVAGNIRPFTGDWVVLKNGNLSFVGLEPGNDKYDGIFEFIIDGTQSKATGVWKAYDSALAVTKRKFELDKKTFAYNPENELGDDISVLLTDSYYAEKGEVVSNDASKFNASMVELKREDIENMSGTDLEIMRNAIYARHGYSFKNRKMRYYFDRFIDWYIPVSTDIRKELTALEKKNIELIKRYEEHAARYYDTFGR